jgi:hypothetical protein
MKPLSDHLVRAYEAIEPQIAQIESPLMRDIANKALSRISKESSHHEFEDEKVKGLMFGNATRNTVKVRDGQWHMETEYRMFAMMQRKSDGHILITEAGSRNPGSTHVAAHRELTGEQISNIQSSQDLIDLRLSPSVQKWVDGESLATQVGQDRAKEGRISIAENQLYKGVHQKFEVRASTSALARSSNPYLSIKRRDPRGFYGLTDDEMTEIEQIPGGHVVLFEFDGMSDEIKRSVDDGVFDLVSNLFDEDFDQVRAIRHQWLADYMMAIAPDYALSVEEFKKMDPALANFIVGGQTQEHVRNRLQFSEIFNFSAEMVEEALKSEGMLDKIDSGDSLRSIMAERLGYASFSKKEFSMLKEYANFKGPYRYGLANFKGPYRYGLSLADSAFLVKLPHEYRPTPEQYMNSVGMGFTHLNAGAAKNSIVNAVKNLESGDPANKKDALQSFSWIKGGDWVSAMKKMSSYPNAENLSDYNAMLEQMMSPAFAHIAYKKDPDSIELDYGDMRATYPKPLSIHTSTLNNTITSSLTSFPSLLLMNDKLHKNFNAITTKYRAIGEYSPALLSWDPLFEDPQTVNGITFNYLSTGSDIVAEGSDMRHCVASYLQPAMAGQSFIVSVQRDGKKESTLELGRDEDGEWHIAQHFGPGNSDVTEDLEVAALDLVDLMNEGEIECNPETGTKEELKDMDTIKSCAIVEGYDFTNREVATGLLKEAMSYFPKGVTLNEIFLGLEDHFLDDLNALLNDEPIKQKEEEYDEVLAM